MARLQSVTIMVRSKQSTLMEAASNSSTHLIAMVRLGDSKSLKRKVLSWHVVMITSFTSSASRTRRWSEKERYGPSTSTVESHMRLTRSSLLPLLSVQLQSINKLVQLLTARSGTMSLSQTTLVMWPSLTTTISQRRSRLSTSLESGARLWFIPPTSNSLP